MGTIVGGKYRLHRTLGEGAMGSVWAAEHQLLGREVAIKFLRESFEEKGTAQARFAAEAKAAAQVKNRFVVDVFDFGFTEGGDSYMVQELLQGRPLADLLTEGPAWSVREAVRFMMDCLTGLSAVHERGIVHRDLKPENIFVIPEVEGSVPKLLDFGISKSKEPARDKSQRRPSLRAPGRGRLTAIGAVLGTPAYMAPEQLRGLSTLDARADLYSLGVVLYEWLAGHCPYASNPNFAELVEQIEARALTPLAQLRPDLDPALCEVVQRALEPDRALRFADALEMRAALAPLLGTSPDAQTRVQAESQPVVRLPPLKLPSLSPGIGVVSRESPSPSPSPSPSTSTSSSTTTSATASTWGSVSVSMRPAGLRTGPSWRFWSAVAVVLGLAAGTAVALRSISTHVAPRVQAAPKAVAPVVAAPVAAPAPPAPAAPADERLPFGALPPEQVPDQELAAPDVAPPTAHAREHRHAKDDAPRTHARPAHEAPEAVPAKPEPKPEPAKPEPSKAEAPDKLLRSLDF